MKRKGAFREEEYALKGRTNFIYKKIGLYKKTCVLSIRKEMHQIIFI